MTSENPHQTIPQFTTFWIDGKAEKPMTKAQKKKAIYNSARDYFRANSLSSTVQSEAYKMLIEKGLFEHETAMAFTRTWKAQESLKIPALQGEEV